MNLAKLMALKKIAFFFTFLLWYSACSANVGKPTNDKPASNAAAKPGPPTPCFVMANPKQALWVDSMLLAMSTDEKIGQLFMVAAYSNRGPEHLAELERLVVQAKIGGVIFFQGGPIRQAKITNRLQEVAKLPLMVGIDGEWGLQMRLQDSSFAFPRQMTLGAHADELLIKRMGKEIARQCKRIGIHVNFAPVVDVNSNPRNPVIGNRSFGENKENVALKGIAYMRGMQEGGILACAKHFPGHGDADADSHYDLPPINRTKQQLDEVELYPFRRLMADSLASVMVAHLLVPAYDKTANRPSTLSPAIVSDLLRTKLKFDGLAFTDALNMKGASAFAKPGELDLKALEAGNDILVFPENTDKAIKMIREAIKSKKYKIKDLDAHVRRILLAKYWLGLAAKPAPIMLEGLHRDLNTNAGQALINECFRASITLVKNDQKLLPFQSLDTMHFASVVVGNAVGSAFQKQLDSYAHFDHYAMGTLSNTAAYQELSQKLGTKKRTIVVGLYKIANRPRENYGLSPEFLAWLAVARQTHKVVVVSFGSPYALKALQDLPTLVQAFEESKPAQLAAAQSLFGAGAISGRLPISLASNMPDGSGIYQADAKRFSFGMPEEIGLDSWRLNRLDTMVANIIRKRITPGCQIVVARRGKVVYNRSFGTLAYHPADSALLHPAKDSVNEATIYDLASVTKVAGTLQAIMFLYERGVLDVSMPLSHYLPELAGTNKADMVVAEVLSHQAGLVPFIPYWRRTIGGRIGQQGPNKTVDGLALALQEPQPQGSLMNELFYCGQSDSNWFNRSVSPGIYTTKAMEDSIWLWTVESNLLPKNQRGDHDYKYSDLSFHIMKRLAEKLLNQPIEDFLAQNLYQPLGLTTMGYRPLQAFPKAQIAPTEIDTYWRKTTVQGTVHDQGAALSGGVGGHAGLFSNALDLATLMQMNMQNGTYGGTRFYQDPTVPFFSKAHFPRNRRGLGWDKPVRGGEGPTSKLASSSTFGHTGFTGTCAWADPENELVFVFLSNRTYPNSDDNRLTTENIRPRMHDIIYRAMLDSVVLN